MKLLISIVFALAVVASFVDAQQPDVVGFWGGEICESYKAGSLSLNALRSFEADETHYTLKLSFYLGSCTTGVLIGQITAAGPYEITGLGTSEGCTVGDVGQVYNIDLFTNETKEFLFTSEQLSTTIRGLCNWTDSGPVVDVAYDIRDLNCANLGVAACDRQFQIVQQVASPARLYFGSASVDTTGSVDPCSEAARPAVVTNVAFIKDLETPNKNSTACFATPLAAPVAQPMAEAPVAVNEPVAVPLNNNINPVSAATNSQTRFIAILGFFVALVLATL